MSAFTSNVCPRLEQMMTRMPGSGRVQLIDDAAAKLTVLDIVLYNEMKTVLELCSLEGSNFADQFPKIDLWLKYVAHKIPQLQVHDKYLATFASNIVASRSHKPDIEEIVTDDQYSAT